MQSGGPGWHGGTRMDRERSAAAAAAIVASHVPDRRDGRMIRTFKPWGIGRRVEQRGYRLTAALRIRVASHKTAGIVSQNSRMDFTATSPGSRTLPLDSGSALVEAREKRNRSGEPPRCRPLSLFIAGLHKVYSRQMRRNAPRQMLARLSQEPTSFALHCCAASSRNPWPISAAEYRDEGSRP